MTTAHYFSKDGTKKASPTDGGTTTGRPCDFIGNERFVMASNSTTLLLGRVTPKFLVVDRTLTITGVGTNTICYGVSVQRDVQGEIDPANAQGDKAYLVTRSTN